MNGVKLHNHNVHHEQFIDNICGAVMSAARDIKLPVQLQPCDYHLMVGIKDFACMAEGEAVTSAACYLIYVIIDYYYYCS